MFSHGPDLTGRMLVNKFLFPLFLLMLFVVSSCARPGSHVVLAPPPGEKTVVISPKKEGRGFKPYVVNGERYYPLPHSHGFVQTGKASWYGRDFHGRPTASGIRYNMYQKTAAHKTLPLGTYVRVLNLENGKQTIVRINDRGPFIKGRIIDLSYAAAKNIGLVGPGVAKVRIEALGRQVGEYDSKSGKEPVVEAADLEKGNFTVQVGAFREKENVLRLAKRLKVLFQYVNITVFETPEGVPLYRLRVSRSTTLKQAGMIEKKLEDMGFEEAFIVSL
jgi:rare lipoprotein A